MASELTDKTTVVFFISRTTMFITKDERDNIIAFMTGYEVGRETNFLISLSKHLENKYNCSKIARDWYGQVELFASKHQLSWEVSFKRLMLEVLQETMDSNEKAKARSLIKSRVRGQIAYAHPKVFQNHRDPDWFSEKWINGWLGLVDLSQRWFTDYWTNEELSIIKKISVEVNAICETLNDKLISYPTEEIIKLVKEFVVLKTAPDVD